MNARLQGYVGELQAILSGPGRDDPATVVARITRALRDLSASPPEIGPELRRLPAQGHGRNLVYRDPELAFVVVAMVWPPGHQGVAHDHASWCVLSVLEGRVEVRNFRRTDEGSGGAGRVSLTETEAFEARAGDVAPVLPPPDHYHVVSNASTTEPALTLHTYGTDLGACHLVDLATGETKAVEQSYHNVHAHQS